MKRIVLAVVATAVLVPAGAVAAKTSSGVMVRVRSTSLGKIVVDPQGRTLYLFEKDKHGRSACSGQCAKFWPPLLTSGKPRASAGVKASLLGVTRRSDGRMQVTYAGHPLYRYLEDKAPGQTKGEGSTFFGASWYVVAPNGKKIDKD